jgi:hypothetical protein
VELYEVPVAPDPEFGLGLRLEVKVDGSTAVAGSYKKHHELIFANDVNVEGKMFDDIIATVRDLGTVSGPGNPMRLTLRRKRTTVIALDSVRLCRPGVR